MLLLCVPDFFDFKLVDIVGIAISISALIAAVWIPVSIMKFQRFTNLAAAYMSYDFAQAFQGVIDFYHDDCGCDVEKIPEKYYERYEHDFKQGSEKKIDAASTLHYQRRYLNAYFLETEFCRRSSSALRKIVKNEFSSSEAYVAKILIYMNKAVDENPEIFKDISQIKHDAMPKDKGLNCYLEKFYNDIKDKGRWM